jgi:hypothetical protein
LKQIILNVRFGSQADTTFLKSNIRFGGRFNCQSLIIPPLLGNPAFPFMARRRDRFPALLRARRGSQIRAQCAGGLTVTTMCDQKVPSSAAAPPRCPSCAQPMRLAKRVSRFDELPDLAVFGCRACGVSHIEAL